MQSTSMAATGCVLAALGLGVAACGGDDSGTKSSGGGGAKSVTIYSSVPLQGESRDQGAALVNGAKLALEQSGYRAGTIKVVYKSLNDSTAQAGQWTAEAASANARKAAQDKSTAAYIGEFNSGASDVSIPILSEAGIAQISPADTVVGLTVKAPGSKPGEPDKYYPTGLRNYARIVPRDSFQGAALVTVMKQDGCTKVAAVNDKEVYGAGLAGGIEFAAKAAGLTITSNDGIDPNAPNYRSLAQKAKAAGADCFVFAGTISNNAVQATKDFAAALPTAKLYGPDSVCTPAYTDPKKGGVPLALDARVKCTVASLPPDKLPTEGREFYKAYTEKYGEADPDPYAIYGYEAMRLALDSIARSKTGAKADVLKALFATKDRQSVLGTYSIDENGDTSLSDYAVYGLKNGELVFAQVIKAATK